MKVVGHNPDFLVLLIIPIGHGQLDAFTNTWIVHATSGFSGFSDFKLF